MSTAQIMEKAKELGIKASKKVANGDLIKMIQEKEGNTPCYQTITSCGQSDCLWWESCQQ